MRKRVPLDSVCLLLVEQPASGDPREAHPCRAQLRNPSLIRRRSAMRLRAGFSMSSRIGTLCRRRTSCSCGGRWATPRPALRPTPLRALPCYALSTQSSPAGRLSSQRRCPRQRDRPPVPVRAAGTGEGGHGWAGPPPWAGTNCLGGRPTGQPGTAETRVGA